VKRFLSRFRRGTKIQPLAFNAVDSFGRVIVEDGGFVKAVQRLQQSARLSRQRKSLSDQSVA
jgi:hypothetical protein